MSNWPKAILFDFDGVIVNSEPLHFAAFVLALKSENIAISEDEYYQELIGFDDRGAFRHLFMKHHRSLDAATFQRVMTAKSGAMKEVIQQGKYEALPGVMELVPALAERFPLAICSGALRGEIEGMLEGLSLRKCFPTIVAAEDVTIGKPDPMGYLLTVKLLTERTGVPLQPADCLIVEDAPSVIRTVRQAGFKVLAVTTSYPAAQLTEANYIVNSLRSDDVSRAVPELKLN